ncbi:hypothetical protein PMI41_03666 [Phyllobacterium sp. YR531]|nr:hypothetical protein PMI41_03666 [Phyllobacterium sp. YR531]
MFPVATVISVITEITILSEIVLINMNPPGATIVPFSACPNKKARLDRAIQPGFQIGKE